MGSNANGKPLRFAALIRVSTEKQEKQGESLRTQEKQITAAVKSLKGVIAIQYGGQEHATEGWERGQLDQLLADAAKRRFDAVIVTDASRWSRDHRNCDKHLDHLRDHGIRFFTLTQEHELENVDARLFLTLSSVINGYQASVTSRKSLANRIERAKRGIPSAGGLPYGRTFDWETKTWGVDQEAKKFMQNLARRLLKGERMVDLSKEYGIGEVTLYLRLKKAGDKFPQRFKGLKDPIIIDVPPLLDATTMKALRKQMERNTTFHRSKLKHKYLLRRLVFCGYCGSAMSGQCQHGVRYYRHLSVSNPYSKGPCRFRGFVRAGDIEDEVMYALDGMCTNSGILQVAIERATPNPELVKEQRTRQQEIDEELQKISRARDRILNQIERDTITDEQAAKKLSDLKKREARLNEEIEQLNTALENVPSAETIKAVSQRIARRRFSDLRAILNQQSNEKRQFVESLFSGKTADGKRMGVYVERLDGEKTLRYKIIGHFGEHVVAEGDALETELVTEFSSCRPR